MIDIRFGSIWVSLWGYQTDEQIDPKVGPKTDLKIDPKMMRKNLYIFTHFQNPPTFDQLQRFYHPPSGPSPPDFCILNETVRPAP